MSCRRWTDSEKDYLRQHYRKVPSAEICAHLDRSMHSVQAQASAMGLTEGLPPPVKVRTATEIEKFRQSMAARSEAGLNAIKIRQGWPRPNTNHERALRGRRYNQSSSW